METEEKTKILGLIDRLELCHHKAARHVELIVQAIGEGHTTEGRRAREAERTHPATKMWRNVVDVLSAWLSGDASEVAGLDVGEYTGEELAGFLGKRTELKEWQVRQVVNKLKEASGLYPGSEYREMVEYPESYEDCREFRNRTVETMIRDTNDGQEAEISLGAAIDHVQPCNWSFPENLVVVLRAINGDLAPRQPFAAHARNVRLNPIGDRMRVIANTLRTYCRRPATGDVDQSVLDELGETDPDKAELAEMLERKISAVFR